jgi:hypothetical protein
VRDLAVLFLHLLATVARLAGPGGARSVVAESVLVKHQLTGSRLVTTSPEQPLDARMTTSFCGWRVVLQRSGPYLWQHVVAP